jgi:archaeal flagellar protein FlaI
MVVEINTSLKIPPLSKSPDKINTDVRYMVIAPYANIHIYWDTKKSELIYELEEPILNEEEKKILEKLENAMRETINVNLVEKNKKGDIISYIDKSARLVISELGMRIQEGLYEKLYYYLYRDFSGLNEIEPLMNDYFIEDIECNGVNEPVYIVHRVFRNLKTNVKFDSVEKLASFVEKLAQKSGRYISYASPLLDGTLPDGSRINATYTKDVTSKGPTFTIRKFTKTPWTPIQLLGFNTLSPEMLAYLWILMQYDSNVMIVGGTASGKTTLLNAMAFFIPPEKRVVSIEDTRELNLPRENWLPSVSRTGASLTGVGEIDLFSLLKASFRQNPDYVIVGEVRGKEASVLFQGMASGHASISTMHADSVDGIIRRLETPPIELSPSLINGLDAVIVMTHAIVKGQETRKLRDITEVVKVQDDGVALTNTPFVWDPAQDKFYFKKESKVFEKISKKFGISVQDLQREQEMRTKLIYEMYKRKIVDSIELQKIINNYYRNSEEVLKEFGIDEGR